MAAQRAILIVAAGWLAWALWLIFRRRRHFQHTSLKSAWGWATGAPAAWLCATVASLAISENPPLLDQIWLWAAILAVCPFISALGARRPTDAVWNWFIILPLIAVLGWPAITAWGYADRLVPVRLQLPATMGFALVLVMGAGNYVGTRQTLPVLLAAGAIALSLLPLSSAWTLARPGPNEIRGCAGMLLSAAVVWGARIARRPVAASTPFDRLWFDFRETFGVVWELRIQERINVTAQKEQWSCRLGPDGWEWDPARTPQAEQETLAKRDHAVRWLLRRFVDPEWIDARAGSGE